MLKVLKYVVIFKEGRVVFFKVLLMFLLRNIVSLEIIYEKL